jgi:hypothetical protein
MKSYLIFGVNFNGWKICTLTLFFGGLTIQNLANSLDTHTRENILGFVDAVENVLKKQLQLDPRATDGSG